MQEQTQTTDLDKIQFEELLLRKKSKENFDSNQFTKVKLKDISVYKGYKFFNIKEYNKKDTSADFIYTISEFDSPEETLKSYKYNKNSKKVVSKVIQKDYIRIHNYNSFDTDNDWRYKDEKYVIVTLSSTDENYEEKHIIDSKHVERSTEELYNKIKDKIDTECLLGKPLLSDKVLRIDKSRPISNKNYLMNATLRTSILYSPFGISLIGLAYFGFQTTLGFYFYPYVIFSFFFLLLTLFIGIKIRNKVYKNWFNLKDYDMVYNLPENAKIKDNIIGNKNYNYDSADIDIYENGDVIVTADNITWTFENNDNIPSKEAIELYEEYGVDFNNNESIPISYYENTNKDKTEYVSDCDNWVLEPYND